LIEVLISFKIPATVQYYGDDERLSLSRVCTGIYLDIKSVYLDVTVSCYYVNQQDPV